MAKGPHIDAATKLEALAELDSGASLPAVSAKYGVSPNMLARWKEAWEDTGSLADDEAEEQAAPKAPQRPAERPREANRQPAQPGGFVTADGRELPALPPQRPGVLRKSFPDDFKYALAEAVRTGRATLADLSRFYGIHDSNIHNWVQKVKASKLKKPKGPAPVRATAKAPPPKPPAQRSLDIEPDQDDEEDPGPRVAIVRAPEPPVRASLGQAGVDTSAHLRAELERLRAENERLKRRLKSAFAMVLDEDPGDGD